MEVSKIHSTPFSMQILPGARQHTFECLYNLPGFVSLIMFTCVWMFTMNLCLCFQIKYTQLQKKPGSFWLVPGSLLIWFKFQIWPYAMTIISIKTKQMKFRIAVTKVRRHSGVHFFSDNLDCSKKLECLEKVNQVRSIVWRLPIKLPP